MKSKLKVLVAPVLVVIAGGLTGLCLHKLDKSLAAPIDRSSSFAGYSQSCWQINDTLHVVTAKGDTVRLDISRLEGAE